MRVLLGQFVCKRLGYFMRDSIGGISQYIDACQWGFCWASLLGYWIGLVWLGSGLTGKGVDRSARRLLVRVWLISKTIGLG